MSWFTQKNKKMKRVTNMELISVILINIGALAFAIYIWLIYDHRQTIINSEEPIQNYSVLEVNCRRRTSSSILIEFNGKQYYVAVARDKCIQFDPQKNKTLLWQRKRWSLWRKWASGKTGSSLFHSIFMLVYMVVYSNKKKT